jgi:hypothetical protein
MINIFFYSIFGFIVILIVNSSLEMFPDDSFERTLVFLILAAGASCIDPYIPNLKNYKSLLVVDGLP